MAFVSYVKLCIPGHKSFTSISVCAAHYNYSNTADSPFSGLRYERGSDSLVVDDWEVGEEIVMALDPSTPALEQAEALFKKARKLRRTSENVEPLLQQAEEDVEYLQEVESQLESLEPGDQADLRALREIEARTFPLKSQLALCLAALREDHCHLLNICKLVCGPEYTRDPASLQY